MAAYFTRDNNTPQVLALDADVAQSPGQDEPLGEAYSTATRPSCR